MLFRSIVEVEEHHEEKRNEVQTDANYKPMVFNAKAMCQCGDMFELANAKVNEEKTGFIDSGIVTYQKNDNGYNSSVQQNGSYQNNSQPSSSYNSGRENYK